VNLTAKAVAALVLPAGKDDEIHFDDALAGYGYRLRRRTADAPVRRTWIAQYRRAGTTRRVKLGDAGVLSAEAARAAAKKVLAAVALGQDPQADVDRRAKDKLSFRGVVDEYLAVKQTQVRPHTFTEVKRYLTGDYFKPLHSLAVDTVTRKDIAGRLVVIVRESGTVTAARARTALGAFFTWTMRMGLTEQNPVVGTIRPKSGEGRAHVLTDAELALIWRNCGDDEFGRIARLLILVPARRQEIGGMRWPELDSAAGTWTLAAERSKNGRAQTLPLLPAAWDIINAVPRRETRDQLFGQHADDGFTQWSASKVEFDSRLGGAVRPYRLHDLRRSVATRMADLGVQPHIIEQILNHQSGHKGGVAGIYNRSSYDREVRAALAMWADHVRALAEDGDRVVHLLSREAVVGRGEPVL
jgi:integrase